jgi:hypothetical protein
LIDCSNTGVNIAEHILQVVSEYGMISKVFSITLNNASAMTELTPKLVPYICGSANVVGLMHQCYACHIINLIVKSGLKRIKEKLEDFIELFPDLILLTSALRLSNPFTLHMRYVLISFLWTWILDGVELTLC